jgi:hypothetical protein
MSHSEIKRDLEAQVLLKFFKFSKRGIWENFPKELSIHHHHPFTPYNHFYSIYHLPFTTIYYIPQDTCISWFDFMTRSFGSIVLIMQYMFHYLPTYELHISLLEVGWEREGIMLLCYQKYHIFWEERKGIDHNCLGTLSFILKILQNSGIIVDQRAWNMALDLTILSFNYLRPKWRLQVPWWKVIWVSFS